MKGVFIYLYMRGEYVNSVDLSANYYFPYHKQKILNYSPQNFCWPLQDIMKLPLLKVKKEQAQVCK